MHEPASIARPVKYVLKVAQPSASGLDFDKDLNSEQRAVVTSDAERLLVLAGAGTGKTRALTYRVARLIAGACPPERIMLVTFTNRAAREMVDRVSALLGADLRRSAAGTFHHVGNRILRKYGTAVGVTPDFSIVDPEDAREILGSVIMELGMSALTAKRFPTPKVVAAMLSLASGTRRPLMKVLEHHFERFLMLAPLLQKVAVRYQQRKRELNLCDFDDLLTSWHQIFEQGGSAAEELCRAYDHVLVDEYQDINALQGSIVDAMVGHGTSLTCVGDDAQSIYRFRGADFALIHLFRDRHPTAKILPLTTNYRSTPQILALANRSIAYNKEQYPKHLSSVRADGPRPALVALRDVYQQAEFVAQRVLELHTEQGLALRQIAVLYRNHAHGLELQVELTRRQIPYQVRSGVRFFEQAHVKDVVSFLRVRHNPRDELAWVRLLRLFPGVGQQTAEKVAQHLGGSMRDAIDGHPGYWLDESPANDVLPALHELFAGAIESLPPRSKSPLESLQRLWETLTQSAFQAPDAAIREVLRHFYKDHLGRTYDNHEQRAEDLENLAGFAQRYADTEAFLSELSLVLAIGAEGVVKPGEVDDRLVLSTIHQAKGLEWPACFVLGLAEGRFPAPQAARTLDELEEERRLFYVACTRAADELYLCYPTIEESRSGPAKLLRLSRFLQEVEHVPPVLERWQIVEAAPDANA